MLLQFPMMLQGMLATTLQWRQLHHLCAPKLLGFNKLHIFHILVLDIKRLDKPGGL